MMRILWLSLILLLNFQPKHERLMILEKEITVSGNTSLGKFDCTYNVEGLKDTLSFVDNKSKDTFLFDIAVADFGCGNLFLNNDFRKTIKAKEFPKARVKVTNLRKNKGSYRCDLHLEIAGKRLYFKDFHLNLNDEKLMGYLRLNFDTLGLDPPRKFGGLVKVDDALYLSLALVF